MMRSQGHSGTDRRLLLLKWFMVFIPPATMLGGHVLLEYRVVPLGHSAGHGGNPFVGLFIILLITMVALALAYLFAEALFRVLRRLQDEALARERDVLTMNAMMEERERLSRELHDGVAQLVAHLLLRMDTIKDLVESRRPKDAEAELERLHGVADEIYKDIGESITGLRTNVAERGLIVALRDYVDQFEERHRVPLRLRADGDFVRELSPLAAFQVFRLIQEALTNVRKHAGAREATVTLTSDGPHQLRVVIADNGRGFMPQRQSNGKDRRMGLTSMRERVAALGGQLEVHSRHGSGTEVNATIPVSRTSREERHAATATPAG